MLFQFCRKKIWNFIDPFFLVVWTVPTELLSPPLFWASFFFLPASGDKWGTRLFLLCCCGGSRRFLRLFFLLVRKGGWGFLFVGGTLWTINVVAIDLTPWLFFIVGTHPSTLTTSFIPLPFLLSLSIAFFLSLPPLPPPFFGLLGPSPPSWNGGLWWKKFSFFFGCWRAEKCSRGKQQKQLFSLYLVCLPVVVLVLVGIPLGASRAYRREKNKPLGGLRVISQVVFFLFVCQRPTLKLKGGAIWGPSFSVGPFTPIFFVSFFEKTFKTILVC